MIDVSHYSDNRRSLLRIGIFDSIISSRIVKCVERIDRRHLYFKLFRENFDRIFIEKIIFGYHSSQSKEHLDNFTYIFSDLFGKLINSYIFRNLNYADLLTLLFMSIVSLSLASASTNRSSLLRPKSICLRASLFLLRSSALILTLHLFIDILITKV